MILSEFFREGYRRAITTGATKIDSAELAPLIINAKSIIKQLQQEPFNPAGNPADQLRADVAAKDTKTHEELVVITDNVTTNLQEAEEPLAQ